MNAAAALILAVLAVSGPYGVLRILLGFAALSAAVGAAASFVKLRKAVRDGDIAKPS